MTCTACGCTAPDPTPVTASLCRTCAQTETPAALKARALAAEAECELRLALNESAQSIVELNERQCARLEAALVAACAETASARRDRDRTIALANAFARAARNEIERERAAIDERLRHEGRIATSRILALADANARLVQWRHDYAEAMRANAELAAIVRALAASCSPISDYRYECLLCQRDVGSYGALPSAHASDCPWRLACEWVAAHPVAL